MGPVPLVLDLSIAHERWESRSNPSLNGNLHYPTDLDRTLNETVVDKVLQYRTDYNNRPSHGISFMPVIVSTSGCLHIEFVHLLFLQDHRETDHFLASNQPPLSSRIVLHNSRVRSVTSSRGLQHCGLTST